jgi:hypothetical protein
VSFIFHLRMAGRMIVILLYGLTAIQDANHVDHLKKLISMSLSLSLETRSRITQFTSQPTLLSLDDCK